MTKPLASLSLDLDNKWSYMKTHGDAGWESYPTYLDTVVPRFLRMLGDHGLTITVFVVGQDAALEKNEAALASIADAGHEIGNHSFKHEPWLHLYSEAEIDEELARTEEHLVRVTGQRPIGFRGPGFSFSPTVLKVLSNRGYQYDGSTFPTYIGPLARMYYFFTARLNTNQKEERKKLFGTWSEGFRPLKPYWWKCDDARILEIPVTTMPILKAPIHVSYLLYLGQFSHMLAMSYFKNALRLCRLTGVEPSLLLHPLDFMGADDDGDLSFFPAMRQPAAKKLALVDAVFTEFKKRFQVLPMREHANALAARGLKTRVLKDGGVKDMGRGTGGQGATPEAELVGSQR